LTAEIVRVPVSDSARKWNLFLISMSTVLTTLDATIANVALPHIQGAMATTQDQLAWVLTSFIVATAIFMPLTGFLCDRFGQRAVLIPAVFFFTLTSALCGLAQNLEQLVLFRFLQGMSGAFILPAGQSLILDIYPPSQYTKALSTWALGTIIGPILGPTLGGYLTEFFNWRWVFLINLPLGLLVVVGMIMVTPQTPLNKTRRMDFTGFAFLSLAIAALQLMFDRGESQGWFNSWEIILEGSLAAVFALMFFAYIGGSKSPYIRLDCFLDRNFAIGTIFIFVNCIVLFSCLALLPGFLQSLLGYPVFTSGMLLMPRGIGTLAGIIIINRLGHRLDPRLFIGAGFIFMAYSVAMMAEFNLEVGMREIVISGFIQGMGLSLGYLPTNILMFSSLAPNLKSDATAISGLSRSIAGSLGISILFTLLARNGQAYHARLGESVTPFQYWLSFPPPWDWSNPAGAMLLNQEVTRQAVMQAYITDFTIIQWLATASLLLLFLIKPVKQRQEMPVAIAE